MSVVEPSRREQLEAELAEHRSGHGITRTAGAAHQRVDAFVADAEHALAEMIQSLRQASITSAPTFGAMVGFADLRAVPELAALVHAAIDRPAAPGTLEVISPYTAEGWQARFDELTRELEDMDAAEELAAATAELKAAKERVKATTLGRST